MPLPLDYGVTISPSLTTAISPSQLELLHSFHEKDNNIMPTKLKCFTAVLCIGHTKIATVPVKIVLPAKIVVPDKIVVPAKIVPAIQI